MINANELRIGNWYKSNNYYTLSTSDFIDFLNEAQVNSGIIKNISPILLTPEILGKAGFIHYTITVEDRTKKQWKRHPGDSFYLYGSDFYYTPYIMPEIKYVHQLQNIYFALTGEELIIKLN